MSDDSRTPAELAMEKLTSLKDGLRSTGEQNITSDAVTVEQIRDLIIEHADGDVQNPTEVATIILSDIGLAHAPTTDLSPASVMVNREKIAEIVQRGFTASDHDRLKAVDTILSVVSFAPTVDVSILSMRLSGNRQEHFVRITCGDRTIDVRKYDGEYLNRAEYERDTLRHVLLGEPKPNLMDPKYADPEEST